MEQLYASQSQPVCKASLCVAPHHVRVPSRRKYVFTDQIDQTYPRDLSQPSRPEDSFGHPVTVQEGRYAALGIEEACS